MDIWFLNLLFHGKRKLGKTKPSHNIKPGGIELSLT